MTNFLIGRQQILDSKLETFAYEILFRGKNFDLNIEEGATSATNEVITDTLLEIGLNEIVGKHKAFINFTTHNLLEKTPLNLPKDRIVIEVLETVAVDLRIISSLRELSQAGYTIALDDFVLTDEWRPLLEIADIIKLDILANSLEETRSLIEQLKPYNLILLAEKVETYHEFAMMKSWGCQLFQGFFFSKPNLVEGKRMGVNQSSAMQLLAAVNKANAKFEDISRIIGHDVGLSYKLLNYINSAFFSLPVKIGSIQQAITFLGMAEVKRWINILTLASISDKPTATLQTALIRGKMCELMGTKLGEDADMLFLVGMLSCLDGVLDLPIEKIMENMPISPEISQAILHKTGKAGEILQFALNYERWELNASNNRFQALEERSIAEIYLKSIQWAEEILINCH